MLRLVCAAFVAFAAVQRSDAVLMKVLWQVGDFDGRAAEFALAPDRAAEFGRRYPADITFRVGQDGPADLPFIHPGPLDTRWSGAAAVTLRLAFELDSVAADGVYLIQIGLADSHEQWPPRMDVSVNDAPCGSQRMPRGTGHAFEGSGEGAPSRRVIALPAEHLRSGANQIAITLHAGSWIAYAALALLKVDAPPWTAPPAPAADPNFAPQAWQADDAALLRRDDGWRLLTLGASGGTAGSAVEPVLYEAELSLHPGRGPCVLSQQSAQAVRGPAWQVVFEPTGDGWAWRFVDTAYSRAVDGGGGRVAGGWVRVRIAHEPGTTTLTVTDADGRETTGRCVRAPVPPGRLTVHTDAGGAFDLTDLRVRPIFAPAPRRPATQPVKDEAASAYDEQTGRVTLRGGGLELVVETRDGLNPCRLTDARTGRVYADSDYLWPNDRRPVLAAPPQIVKLRRGVDVVVFRARLDKLEFRHTFVAGHISAHENPLEETITITNTGDGPLDTSDFACGFARRIADARGPEPALDQTLFTAVPFRVSPGSGNTCEYTVRDLLWRQDAFTFAPSAWRPVPVANWPSEAWVWGEDGAALLIGKYNTDDLEWSLLDHAWRRAGDDWHLLLRFGGAGRSKAGDPQGAAQLAPGQSFTFGTTRFTLVHGTWQDAYYAYRAQMDRRGHGLPAGYDPPVHWNELYDNPLWWTGDSAAGRAQHYTLDAMRGEAAKARELGCEALYLDPGWDTSFGSVIWATDRLGPMDEFVRRLADDYGLVLSLHTPIAPWIDPAEYPVETRLMDEQGRRLGEVCAASSVYGATVVARHLELCRNGARFLMYDGSRWPGSGACWDPAHGHSVPLKHLEHINAIVRITQQVHAVYPDVLIEQHDPMAGPSEHRYCPMYFMHDKPGAFDEHWGDEHMWFPMEDLRNRRSIAQYYYCLAYNLPVYLHFDLRHDNIHCLLFWWNASTCRHLGLGGRHADPAVWEAQQAAMRVYRAHKRFFPQGAFYGLEESVHAHTLADERTSVLNVFNLTDADQEREIVVRPAASGLPPGAVQVDGALAEPRGEDVLLRLPVPAMGHRLVKLRVPAP